VFPTHTMSTTETGLELGRADMSSQLGNAFINY